MKCHSGPSISKAIIGLVLADNGIGVKEVLPKQNLDEVKRSFLHCVIRHFVPFYSPIIKTSEVLLLLSTYL